MSDYLGRLVDRSLGVGEPVLPRPVSLFETGGPGPAPPETSGETSGEPSPPQTLRAILHQPRPLSTPSSPQPRERGDAPASLAPSPPRDPERPSAPIPSPEHHAALDPPAPPPAVPPVLGRRSAEAAGARKPRLEPAPPAPPTVVHHLERERVRPVPVAPHPPRPVVLQPVTRETAVERVTVVEKRPGDERRDAPVLQPKTIVQPEVRRVEVLRPAPPPRERPPAPVLAPRVERERGPAEAQPAAAPEIHVTIGRLEIRAAAQPPAPPRRAREQAAVMSLDDYLRQRASGSKP